MAKMVTRMPGASGGEQPAGAQLRRGQGSGRREGRQRGEGLPHTPRAPRAWSPGGWSPNDTLGCQNTSAAGHGITRFISCRSSCPSCRDGTSSVQPGVLSPSSAPASFPSPGQREGWLLPRYSLTPLGQGPRAATPAPASPTGAASHPAETPDRSRLLQIPPGFPKPLLPVTCPGIWKNPARSPLGRHAGSSDAASDRWDAGTAGCGAGDQHCARCFKNGVYERAPGP